MKIICNLFCVLGLAFLASCKEDDLSGMPVQIYPGVYQDACLTYADGNENRLGDCGVMRDTVIILTPDDLSFNTVTASSSKSCPVCEVVTFYYDFDVDNTCAKFEQQCSTIVYMRQPDIDSVFVQRYFPDYRMKVNFDTKRFGGGGIHWVMPLTNEMSIPELGLYQYTYQGTPNCKGKSIESTKAAWTQIDDFSSFSIDFPKQGEKFEDNLPLFKQYFSHFELHMRYAVAGENQFK